MLGEISTWILPCLGISIVKWYEGLLDGTYKIRHLSYSSNGSHKAYVKEKALNN